MKSSPDRYISPRPAAPAVAYRLSKPPQSLSPRERYTRQRDDSVDPFRTTSGSRSRNALTRRLTGPRGSPIYHVPSFVNGHDAALVNIEVNEEIPRQTSAGAVWNVGGTGAAQGGNIRAVTDGSGGLLASGSNAPLHTAHFLDEETPADQRSAHETRLAIALGIDLARPILRGLLPDPSVPPTFAAKYSPFLWQNGAWTRTYDHQNSNPSHTRRGSPPGKAVPLTPFRVLDAPNLKDDYYCTVLAYSHSHRTLAVALTQKVYLWTEKDGVQYPPIPQARHSNYVTSLSFSSTEGGKGILAVSRNSGQVLLWGINEPWARFEAPHAHTISCLSFKPTVSYRPSTPEAPYPNAYEDLLVGDDMGTIYYYSVEWTDLTIPGNSPTRPGSMNLLARVSAHVQNICGLAWCPDGKHFATGGNDNTAFFFDISKVLNHQSAISSERPRGRTRRRSINPPVPQAPVMAPAVPTLPVMIPTMLTPPASPESPYNAGNYTLPDFQTRWATTFNPLPTTQQTSPPPSPQRVTVRSPPPRPEILTPLPLQNPPRAPYQLISRQIILKRLSLPLLAPIRNMHTHAFIHSAAVKALAFAPWQPSLLATGGGSNDRQIHFYHTGSGATLAVINVFAQITCLIWSRTRREIAATFGYAQPEHGVRVAVFAWPSCDCVVKIPWEGRPGMGEVPRALWAVGYPGGPNDEVSGISGARSRIRLMPMRTGIARPRAEEERTGSMQWTVVAEMERRAREQNATREGGDEEEDRDIGRGTGETDFPNVLATDMERERHAVTEDSDLTSPLPSPPLSPPTRRAAEGDAWTSRTEEEGGLIIACCDSTVKFFEVWAGNSKSRKGRGLGGKVGVLGGSRILEGEVVGIYGDELGGVGRGNGQRSLRMGGDVIR